MLIVDMIRIKFLLANINYSSEELYMILISLSYTFPFKFINRQ